jgi:hypothetical protein
MRRTKKTISSTKPSSAFPAEPDMVPVPVAALRALGVLGLLIHTISSMPSFDNDSFKDGSLLTFGSVLHSRAEPYEIRGVHGGRKKRYIVEREEPSSCSKEVICLPTLGNIIKDCKCQKCPIGVPALDGKSCQDNCPQVIITLKAAKTPSNATN